MQTSSDTPFRSLGPGTLLAPVPCVLLSCRGTREAHASANLITVAWAGTVCSDPPMISVSIRPERYSHALICESSCFCLNLVSASLCRAADFCGVRSGRDIDKWEALSLHELPVEGFGAPALAEAPAFLLCRVTERVPLGSHDLFLCRVEDVRARADLLDAQGALHLERAGLVAYSHGEYYGLQPDKLGFFGYSVASPKALARRMGASDKRRAGKRT